ncbi:MAG: DUF6362 family protein [Alphaproteobacteria bacterium]
MGEWTASQVEERLVEAADVLRRLPEERVRGFFTTWPMVVQDGVGPDEPPRLRRPPPSAAAISRMDETLAWLSWLDTTDAKVLWLRASGERWKAICWKVGMARTAANEHWLYGLCLIAWKLNRRPLPRKRSRRYVIENSRSMPTSEMERRMFANTSRTDKADR